MKLKPAFSSDVKANGKTIFLLPLSLERCWRKISTPKRNLTKQTFLPVTNFLSLAHAFFLFSLFMLGKCVKISATALELNYILTGHFLYKFWFFLPFVYITWWFCRKKTKFDPAIKNHHTTPSCNLSHQTTNKKLQKYLNLNVLLSNVLCSCSCFNFSVICFGH